MDTYLAYSTGEYSIVCRSIELRVRLQELFEPKKPRRCMPLPTAIYSKIWLEILFQADHNQWLLGVPQQQTQSIYKM